MRTLTMRGYLALFLLLGAVIAGVGFAGSAMAQSVAMPVRHATGEFVVAMTPNGVENAEAGLGLSSYNISKIFTGGMIGSGEARMVAGGPAGSQDTGTYVAIERFVGSVDGQAGAFLLAHRGDMTPDGYTLSITVVPNSGTGALEGIEGEFILTVTEDGAHHYDLAYRLP